MPIVVHKNRGETPLSVINRVKAQRLALRSETISYAGRLDPMAEGLLLLLVGDENKKRHDFERFEKTYEVDVLLGIETDSYDLLGLITNHREISHDTEGSMCHYVKTHTGTFQQSYPPFSSKPVNGKPLYYWAREKRLSEVVIPSKEVTVSSFTPQSHTSLPMNELKLLVSRSIDSVIGNFRQDEIRESWADFFRETSTPSFPIFTYEITCSSGTYIRSIAQDIGRTLGCGAIAMRIKRTRIGPYSLAVDEKAE